MNIEKSLHLYSRFGFGLDGKSARKVSMNTFERELKRGKALPLNLELPELSDTEFWRMSNMEKREMLKEARKKTLELNVLWLKRMLDTEQHLREKMNLFWHHHFACMITNPYFALEFTNALREHALGNFRDLLLSVAKSGAMIDFLHTRQNRKGSPNEDWARELCELFTLGRDNEYTEQDVKEIARAFTGWKYRLGKGFFVAPRQHDSGKKTVFGQEGYYGGEEAIDLILRKRACARFISESIYTYFVNPQPHSARIEELTTIFYDSNYDIATLIWHIAHSDWFYAEENINCRIKSPIEWLVGFGRLFKLKNEEDKMWILLQRLFDQILYRPPNVKGWKVDREWIDSNSLPLRLRLPSILLNNGQLEMEFRPDYDSNPNKAGQRFARRLNFSCDWDYFFERNQKVDYQMLFFKNRLSEQGRRFLNGCTFESPKEEAIQLLSLPEYQMM